MLVVLSWEIMGKDAANVDIKDLESLGGYWFRFDSWYAILISVVIWTVVYQSLLRLLPNKNKEYCCRILSFVHGLITAFVGINQCFMIDWPFKHPEWRTTRSQRFVFVCSLGYFLHDLWWVIKYDRDQRLMLAHHMYSSMALYRMLYKGYSGAQATCSLGCLEISNPFLQVRWFLRSEGYYPSVAYSSVEIVFMLVFFFVRIVLGTVFLVVVAYQPKNDWEFRLFAVMIYIMSWMFMLNILKYFMTKYKIGAKRQAENDK